MRRWALNADLGEGEPAARTRALMRWIHSANVACGGHAGGTDAMVCAIRAAQRHGVRLGAHPGLWSHGESFGRTPAPMTSGALALLLLHQVGALERLARDQQASLHHIKLHGALYHMTESDPDLARAYVEAVRRWWPRLKIYALAGGQVTRAARSRQVPVWEEAFLDRAYQPDGTLVARGRKGAMLTRIADIRDRLRGLRERGEILAVDGSPLAMQPRTLCVHGDTPGAVRLVRQVSQWLRDPA